MITGGSGLGQLITARQTNPQATARTERRGFHRKPIQIAGSERWGHSDTQPFI